MPDMRVAVIGAGIGGLTAALALRSQGIDAQVYERGAGLSRVQMGGGLHMWTNAMKAMRHVGLVDRVQAMGEVLDDTVFLSWKGKQLAHWPVGEIGRDNGVPDVGVSRRDLHAVLAAAVGEDALHFGSVLTDFVEDADGVVARFADGREERVDALIGADGIRSTIRAQLLGAAPPRFAGYTQWQTVTTAGAELLPRGKEYIVFGGAQRAVLHHVNDGALFWTCVVYGPLGGAEQLTGRKARLEELFEGWMDPLPQAISVTPEEEITGFDICDRPPVKAWGTGRVTLLGDAAHPLTTNLSQGACLAMEDGVTLARCLASATPVATSLREYEQLRIARTSPIVSRSWRIAGMGGWKNPVAMQGRDAIMRFALGGPGLKDHRAFAASDF